MTITHYHLLPAAQPSGIEVAGAPGRCPTFPRARLGAPEEGLFVQRVGRNDEAAGAFQGKGHVQCG